MRPVGRPKEEISYQPIPKFFADVSFEAIVLNGINNILSSSLFVGAEGETNRSHIVFGELVQTFDAFVHPVIEEYSEGQYDIGDYLKERAKVRKEWDEADDADAQTRCATELFRTTVRVLSRQRLFKVRHYSFVVIGKKKESKFPTLKDIMGQELEDEDSV